MAKGSTHFPISRMTGFTTNTGAGWGIPQYDAAGNMTEIPITPGNWFGSPPTRSAATYDAWNRLLSESYGGSSYRYDGLGRRITLRLYDSAWRDYYYTGHQLIEERSPYSDPSLYQYVWSLRYIDEMALRDK